MKLRPESRHTRLSLTVFAVLETLAIAVAVAAGLGISSAATSGPAPGTVQLREVVLDGEHLAVLIAPGRPGINLIHVGTDGDMSVGRALTAMTPLTEYPAAGGRWALIWLSPGPGTMWFQRGPSRASFPIDTGAATADPSGQAQTLSGLSGPDAPECASAALGAVLTTRGTVLTGCPTDQLADIDAIALSKLAGFLARRGTPIALIGDSSARSVAAGELVRRQLGAQGLSVLPEPQPGHPVLITAGWAAAKSTIDRIATGSLPALGTYLAPWLLTAPVLANASGAILPLPFDPHASTAQAYRNVLRHLNDIPPSASGYRAFMAAASSQPSTAVRLYAVSRVTIFPNGHDHTTGDGWMPGGTTTPVTPTL